MILMNEEKIPEVGELVYLIADRTFFSPRGSRVTITNRDTLMVLSVYKNIFDFWSVEVLTPQGDKISIKVNTLQDYDGKKL